MGISMTDNRDKETHKRRVHYSGKYPKKFEEKYKELQPEKYAETIEHVKAKGNTPAGTHISIMVSECMEYLNIKPGERGLDCTFGYGGHSRRILEALGGEGHLTSLDVDPIESAKSCDRIRALGYGEDSFSLELTNFANVDEVCRKHGKFDFVLADLGVSSMQIDDPSRGFSYKVDATLDLRMDPTKGESAADFLKKLSTDEIIEILIKNSDEPYAQVIAKTIVSERKSGRAIKTTLDFKNVIEKALAKTDIPAKEMKDAVKKACARCFQALRIEINDEFGALESLLRKLPEVLNPGGRVVFLTFHSGEDRLVKGYFKEYFRQGIYSEISKDVIRPSMKECVDNPRAKSTKLRYAVMRQD